MFQWSVVDCVVFFLASHSVAHCNAKQWNAEQMILSCFPPMAAMQAVGTLLRTLSESVVGLQGRVRSGSAICSRPGSVAL